MGIEIKVSTDAQKASAFVRRVALQQLPFAGSRALNATARDAAAGARKALEKKFTVRSKRGNRGIRVQYMTKQDWPSRGPRVEWRDYLAQHETGGRVRPAGGARAFAIPTRFVSSKRTGAGKIRKTFKPRQAIGAGRAVVEEREGQGFVAKRPPKRKTRRTSPIRLWFLLRRRITLRPVLDARGTIAPIVASRYPRHFRIEMAKAIRTARR